MSRRITGFIAAGAMAIAVAIGGYTIAQTNSSNNSSAAAAPDNSTLTAIPSRPGPGHGGSNARSGPAAGGAVGTVDSLSTSSFTISTAGGQKVTVNEESSTTYQNGTSSTSARTMTGGESVLVLGTTNGTTITATQVIVQPNGDGGSAASSAAGVIPFQQGAPTTAKQVGKIPDYTEGSGTIVSGTAADKATQAALAAYPGGIVDRVVQLSGGEYEVHNIGVNWPHHIFVNQDFTVVGAE